ncbi:hypothetical protein P170DRAFT_134454 [Aspergillus steynii IBT 23096]|uniref:Uncharacterized protein n=1 Tax=Aspergillus steynii IBT 23096 TaxID=1392250 RepID=A0A2I2GAU1_9EURO|nr:uncharacterized protein P170DRAFT_134454 [Aspergillus steynii IBT 23096]PLB49988.1 hypothetical protein P170DRAFT_134454 [Aspergillus steynii IBT 23096]
MTQIAFRSWPSQHGRQRVKGMKPSAVKAEIRFSVHSWGQNGASTIPMTAKLCDPANGLSVPFGPVGFSIFHVNTASCCYGVVSAYRNPTGSVSHVWLGCEAVLCIFGHSLSEMFTQQLYSCVFLSSYGLEERHI